MIPAGLRGRLDRLGAKIDPAAIGRAFRALEAGRQPPPGRAADLAQQIKRFLEFSDDPFCRKPDDTVGNSIPSIGVRDDIRG
jgi:hypothetical protein